MNFAQKFGLALVIIAGTGLIIDAQKTGSFSKSIATSPHVPLIALGAAAYLVNR